MKLFIRTLVVMVMLTESLSSCYSLKDLNKKNEPFSEDFLSKLEPGKRYEFRLKTGLIQTIYLTGVADKTITGFYYEQTGKGKKTKTDYSASFQTVQENVTKISLRKFNPILTTVAIVVPTTLLVIIAAEAAQNIVITF